MQTTYKRKNAKINKGGKKSFFASVRFLIAAFAFVFFLLAAVTANAMTGTIHATPDTSKTGSSANLTDYTSIFTFKNEGILFLTPESKPTSDCLVISNQNAVTGFAVTDPDGNSNDNVCVSVSIKPFVITPIKVGDCVIHLTAKMQNQSIQTITLKVFVVSHNNTNPVDTSQPSQEPEYKLGYKTIFACSFSKELDFFIVNQTNNEQITDFSLSFLIIEGNATVNITHNTANLTFIEINTFCTIKFFAFVDTKEVEFLFVN